MAKLKKYDSDYKQQTVEYILEQRKSLAQVARELDISAKLFMVGSSNIRSKNQVNMHKKFDRSL
jgi:transposase-like protein